MGRVRVITQTRGKARLKIHLALVDKVEMASLKVLLEMEIAEVVPPLTRQQKTQLLETVEIVMAIVEMAMEVVILMVTATANLVILLMLPLRLLPLLQHLLPLLSLRFHILLSLHRHRHQAVEVVAVMQVVMEVVVADKFS